MQYGYNIIMDVLVNALACASVEAEIDEDQVREVLSIAMRRYTEVYQSKITGKVH